MSRKKEIKQDLIATIKILENSSSLRERDSDDTITYSYNNLGQLLQANNNDSSMNEKKQDGKETTFKFNFDL